MPGGILQPILKGNVSLVFFHLPEERNGCLLTMVFAFIRICVKQAVYLMLERFVPVLKKKHFGMD
jgi:hypothetical protein